MGIFQLTTIEFLNSDLARGIIASASTDKLLLKTDIKSQSIWIPLLVGSFMKALYHQYWKIRTSKIQSLNQEKAKKIKKQEQRNRKEKLKQEAAKRAKALKELKNPDKTRCHEKEHSRIKLKAMMKLSHNTQQLPSRDKRLKLYL